MSEIEIEAKTVEEAIHKGLDELKAPRERVEIKILDEGTSGLFGLMGNKPAKVRLTVREEGEVNTCTADYAKAQIKIKEIAAKLLNLMGIEFTEINTSLMTGRILVDIKTADSSLIIGKNAQTLEALESIANLILHRDADTRVKAILDVEGYRKLQEEKFQSIARKAADEVKLTGKAYRFEPMTPHERRIVHMALKNDTDIETLSVGEGSQRKVMIKPKSK